VKKVLRTQVKTAADLYWKTQKNCFYFKNLYRIEFSR